ncbi:phosphotransferase family protein [Kitasatospora sp. NPDC057015]|uniref:phosphotransferase family protein n=1 Tax=Kitasatospora sp. NPDC057015 TaxID=3346001 RepID=UPI00363C0271
MDNTTGRTVTAHLTHRGERLGRFGPFEVEGARWSMVGPVTGRLEELLGVPVAVLRLVAVTGGDGGRGGHTVYHVEALERPAGGPPSPLPGEPATVAEGHDGGAHDGGGHDDDDALLGPADRRADWATAEGLRSALAWASDALRAAGRTPTGPAEQIRTWNLSGLVRLPAEPGTAWLKTTNPAFNACEATVMELVRAVDPGLVPEVLAADRERRRLLLAEVPGEDCWGPSAETVADVVPRLVAVQAALAHGGAFATTAAESGLPDRTLATLPERVRRVLDGEAARELTPTELTAARGLLDRLPALIADLAACGLPDTLVHGDFHPGNWRSDGRRTVVLDFADSCWGNPALDGLRPRAYVGDERWAQIAELWAGAWAVHAPGSDPARALALAEPLAHLLYAVRYQEFLDSIETSERPYHEGDPASEIRAALACG